MDENLQTRTSEGDSTLIQNLVARFPMSCVCFEPVFDECQTIVNFIILHVNAGFETMIGLDAAFLTGKSIANVFGPMNMDCVREIVVLVNQTFASKSKTLVLRVRVLGHVYRASFLFLSDERLLITFEDIHAQYFRKNYYRSIPRDIVTNSIAKSQLTECPVDQIEAGASEDASPVCEAMRLDEFKPLEIIQDSNELSESYDDAFRDSLTGLYDRVFAMEALRMFVDSGVLPLSIVLGDVNGLKTINESLGYHAGDDVLVKIAQALQDNCREDDVVTRWNDGQFMLLLPKASQSVTQQIVKRLQTKLNTICHDAYNIVTFGYATCEEECRAAEDLIREAEKWVYQKKLLINQSHRSSIIRLLVSMLHEKSAETQEHSDRMAAHCRLIVKDLRLSDELVDDLILLSMLHDIGKIGIPDSILNKPGPLTDEERQIIKKHPEIGYRIAQTVTELKQVAGYILAHHEHWDGGGYPKGLKGEEIPIASRIIAVVDAFDVITTGRQYRPARSKEEAIAELQRCAGTQFDPNVVAAYVRLLNELE